MKTVTHLTDTLTFKRGLTVKNRLAIPPMTTRMSYYDGTVTGDEIAYYGMRTGAVGMFITGVAYIQPNGKCWTGELSVDDDAFLPNLSKLRRPSNGTEPGPFCRSSMPAA